MGGVPPMGIMPIIPCRLVIGIGTDNEELTNAFYLAVCLPLNLNPETVEDRLRPDETCTLWGRALLVRREESPTTGANIFLQAEEAGQIDAVAEAVQAAVSELQPSGYTLRIERGEDVDREQGITRTWIQFADPAGNVVWVTFTEPNAAE